VDKFTNMLNSTKLHVLQNNAVTEFCVILDHWTPGLWTIHRNDNSPGVMSFDQFHKLLLMMPTTLE